MFVVRRCFQGQPSADSALNCTSVCVCVCVCVLITPECFVVSLLCWGGILGASHCLYMCGRVRGRKAKVHVGEKLATAWFWTVVVARGRWRITWSGLLFIPVVKYFHKYWMNQCDILLPRGWIRLSLLIPWLFILWIMWNMSTSEFYTIFFYVNQSVKN